MGKLFSVQTNWITIDRSVENLATYGRLVRPFLRPPYIENATRPERNHSDPSYNVTAHENVRLVHVGWHDYPLAYNREYDVEVTYGALSGPWGLTRSIAYVKYALSSQDEHASTSVQLMGVDYAARISMKLKSKFSDLAAFKPYHDRLKKEYKGDVKRLARAVVFNTDDAYREYALLGGVLFHEYLHFKLAQIDGALRYKDLRKAMSGKSPFANAVQARAALTGEVDTIFKGWRGLITYRPSYNDHAYVWEEEFKYLVRRYEKTL